MTVRPSLTSAPKPTVISLKREPWMKVPLVEPSRAPSPRRRRAAPWRDGATPSCRRAPGCTRAPSRTRRASCDSCTCSPRSGPLMTRKMPPGRCRVNAGDSSRTLVTLVSRGGAIERGRAIITPSPPRVKPEFTLWRAGGRRRRARKLGGRWGLTRSRAADGGGGGAAGRGAGGHAAGKGRSGGGACGRRCGLVAPGAVAASAASRPVGPVAAAPAGLSLPAELAAPALPIALPAEPAGAFAAPGTGCAIGVGVAVGSTTSSSGPLKATPERHADADQQQHDHDADDAARAADVLRAFEDVTGGPRTDSRGWQSTRRTSGARLRHGGGERRASAARVGSVRRARVGACVAAREAGLRRRMDLGCIAERWERCSAAAAASAEAVPRRRRARRERIAAATHDRLFARFVTTELAGRRK